MNRRLWRIVAMIAVSCVLPVTGRGRGDDAVLLRESFAVGYQYHVSSRVELGGALALPAEEKKPAKTLPVVGNSAIEYDERVLAVDGDAVKKTARIYRRADFRRKVGDRSQEATLRPAVRRLVLLRLGQVEVPFSPDGALLWGEIDLVRTDVFTPALLGLLPTQAVRPGDRWQAADAAVQELTDLERLEDGKVECRLDQVTVLQRRRLARVTFSGSVRGVNEDGPSRQRLDGYLFFDLESRHISYVSLKGVHVLLDKSGQEQGRIEGQFVLTRQLGTAADLSDAALRGVKLEPDDDNTLLLYDNDDLGVRFLYPRRWRVAGARGRQLCGDESRGSGLMLTIEPASGTPTGAQYLAESRAWLQARKARLLRTTEPRQLRGPPNALEHFTIEMEADGRRALLEYFVVRQKMGGVTLAARLLPHDLATLRREVERLARSIEVTRPIVESRK